MLRTISTSKIFFQKSTIIFILLLIQSCAPINLFIKPFQEERIFKQSQVFKITEEIKSIPYKMMIYENSEIEKSFMVLAYVDNNFLTWSDKDSKLLTSFSGKIISSQGFDNDFESISPPDIKDIYKLLLETNDKAYRCSSLIRFKNPSTKFLEVEHKFYISQQNRGKLHKNLRSEMLSKYIILSEEINIKDLRLGFINHYWIDLDGNILRSKQNLFPRESKFFFEII